MLRVEDCKPGVLVECVDDVNCRGQLRRRAIYTIESYEHVHAFGGSFDSIYLVGVEMRGRGGWLLTRFRLLPDASLDQFRRQLTERLPRPWWWPADEPYADQPVEPDGGPHVHVREEA